MEVVTDTLSAAVQELQRGQDSAKKLRDILSAVSSVDMKPLKEELEGGGGRPCRPPPAAEGLLGDVLRSLNSTLSILNGGDSEKVSQVSTVGHCNLVKSEESEESSKSSAPRDRRGCYKRRKSSDSWTTLSPSLVDDGHQWRKYGQKSILNSNFPRSYFRCTHRLDQGCQAKKQVQKISDDPPVFRTIYHGKHTCRSLLKPPQIILADSSPGDSSILLSFETGKSPDSTTNAQLRCSSNVPFSCSMAPSSAMKFKAREDIVTNDVNEFCNQPSSSEYEGFPSPDFPLLKSAMGSDQGEVLSSSDSFDDNMDLMIDGIEFEDMLTRHFW